MITILRLRIVLVVVGMLIFAWGVKLDESAVRWVGVGFVFVAWMLRFWRTRQADSP